MTILHQLIQAYESRGFTISTGLNPYHLENQKHVPFTYLLKDGEQITDGLGVALQEVFFLECLLGDFDPGNSCVIGNSFGWSTLALGLAIKQAHGKQKGTILALDSGDEDFSLTGLDLTNEIAEEHGLDIRAVQGTSPEDVARLCDEHLDGPLGLAFIDGLHKNKQIVLDFRACQEKAGPDCVYVFHDVINFKLMPGFTECQEASGLKARVMYRTPSGMALLYPRHMESALQPALNTFSGDKKVFKAFQEGRLPR